MLTVHAAPGSLAERVGQIVKAGSALTMPSAIVNAIPYARAAPLGDLTDTDLETGCIVPLADLAETLAGLVAHHRRIVLIGATAGLGDWDAALTGAFAAGATGLMRSVALEYMSRNLVINMIAVPSQDPAQAAQVAMLASALLLSDGVNAQVIPCDRGDNLRMSRARLRRTALP